MHQSTTPSLSQTIWPRWASKQFVTLPIVQTLLLVTFGYSLSSEAVVMRKLKRWKRLWRRSLTHSHKRTSMGPSRSCWNSTTSALQPEEITSKGTRVSCVDYQLKCSYKKKSGNLSYGRHNFRYKVILDSLTCHSIYFVFFNCGIKRFTSFNLIKPFFLPPQNWQKTGWNDWSQQIHWRKQTNKRYYLIEFLFIHFICWLSRT